MPSARVALSGRRLDAMWRNGHFVFLLDVASSINAKTFWATRDADHSFWQPSAAELASAQVHGAPAPSFPIIGLGP